MKSLIIYHQIKPGIDCPDGIAAAWVAARFMKKLDMNFDVLGCSYQQEPPDVSDYDNIFVLDFSFTRSVVESWILQGKHVNIVDHHKTVLENHLEDVSAFSDKFRLKFDLLESGATLTWRHFNVFDGVEPPAFLQYVRDRDLWNHALPMTAEIHEASANMRYEIKKTAELTGIPTRDLIFAAFDYLAMLSQEELIKLMGDRGFELLKPKIEAIDKAASRMKYWKLPTPSDRAVCTDSSFNLLNDSIPVVTLNQDGSEDRLVSDICSALYKSRPDAPFVACITSTGDWSLRSDKDGSNFDVSAIAKMYGGGGHRNSAGFKMVAE
jgi:uncharacterized protein